MNSLFLTNKDCTQESSLFGNSIIKKLENSAKNPADFLKGTFPEREIWWINARAMVTSGAKVLILSKNELRSSLLNPIAGAGCNTSLTKGSMFDSLFC